MYRMYKKKGKVGCAVCQRDSKMKTPFVFCVSFLLFFLKSFSFVVQNISFTTILFFFSSLVMLAFNWALSISMINFKYYWVSFNCLRERVLYKRIVSEDIGNRVKKGQSIQKRIRQGRIFYRGLSNIFHLLRPITYRGFRGSRPAQFDSQRS